MIVRRRTGAAIQDVIPAVARLRVAVFRDWPYLYDGDPDGAYGHAYLSALANAGGGVVVTAEHEGRIVGAATGQPLGTAHDYVRAPFRAQGLDIAARFYFGESVLERELRGRGLARPAARPTRCPAAPSSKSATAASRA